jgi:hypothetical protein
MSFKAMGAKVGFGSRVCKLPVQIDAQAIASSQQQALHS